MNSEKLKSIVQGLADHYHCWCCDRDLTGFVGGLGDLARAMDRPGPVSPAGGLA